MIFWDTSPNAWHRRAGCDTQLYIIVSKIFEVCPDNSFRILWALTGLKFCWSWKPRLSLFRYLILVFVCQIFSSDTTSLSELLLWRVQGYNLCFHFPFDLNEYVFAAISLGEIFVDRLEDRDSLEVLLKNNIDVCHISALSSHDSNLIPQAFDFFTEIFICLNVCSFNFFSPSRLLYRMAHFPIWKYAIEYSISMF